MKWKRPTVNADRTFTVECPFFLAAGALHVEDATPPVTWLHTLNLGKESQKHRLKETHV